MLLIQHAAKATSWDMAVVEKVQGMHCVETVQMDMCRFGMIAVDDKGARRPVQKCTKLMTNSQEVALRVHKQCPNRDKSKPCDHHKHCQLEGGKRCTQAQVYPICLYVRLFARAYRLRKSTTA